MGVYERLDKIFAPTLKWKVEVTHISDEKFNFRKDLDDYFIYQYFFIIILEQFLIKIN